jgi:hypothetical protein
MLDLGAVENRRAGGELDQGLPFGVLVSVPSVIRDTSGWSLCECIGIEAPGAKVMRRIRRMCPGQLVPASTVASV